MHFVSHTSAELEMASARGSMPGENGALQPVDVVDGMDSMDGTVSNETLNIYEFK